MSIFITGASGFLGSHLLAQLLKQGHHCFAHVRCVNKTTGREKILRALSAATDLHTIAVEQLEVIPGDVTAPMLGMMPHDLDNVLHHCDEFIHCAAIVRFDAPHQQAYEVNVTGTKALLAIAERRQYVAGLKRVDIVSTAYIAGTATGEILEAAPLPETGFRNSYEASQHQAELYVLEKMSQLPITVFRPSIIIGEAGDGKTSQFTAIHGLLKFYARGQWRILPANRHTPIDLVTVDYVRDALLEIRKQPESIGEFLHLCAGKNNVLSIAEIVETAQLHCRKAKRVIYHPVFLWLKIMLPLLTLMERVLPLTTISRVLPVLRAYLPYTRRNPLFNDDKAQKLLHGSTIRQANIHAVIDDVFDYAITSDFGNTLSEMKSDATVIVEG